MTITTLDSVLWAAGFIGHVALLLVLLLRRRSRSFPVFTALIGFEAFRTVLLFLVLHYGTRVGYARSYWITGFCDYVFQVALIYEIARNVLRPTGTWVADARRSFLGLGALGLLVAVMLGMALGSPQAKGLDLWDVRVTVFTSLLMCELFLAMLTTAHRLGLRQGTQVMALGQGFTAWAMIALLGNLGHMIYGWDREFAVFDRARMFAYLGTLGFWIAAFWLPERERAPLSPEMQDYLVALHRRVQYDVDRFAH